MGRESRPISGVIPLHFTISSAERTSTPTLLVSLGVLDRTRNLIRSNPCTVAILEQTPRGVITKHLRTSIREWLEHKYSGRRRYCITSTS